MEKENALLIKEIMENLNWKERIVVKIFKKIILKVYHNERIKIINKLL